MILRRMMHYLSYLQSLRHCHGLATHGVLSRLSQPLWALPDCSSPAALSTMPQRLGRLPRRHAGRLMMQRRLGWRTALQGNLPRWNSATCRPSRSSRTWQYAYRRRQRWWRVQHLLGGDHPAASTGAINNLQAELSCSCQLSAGAAGWLTPYNRQHYRYETIQ